MTDYNFVPNFPGLGDDVLGTPYNPAGPEFAEDWLNIILKRGAATHWTTLTGNATATVAEHGRAYFLDDYTLALDPASALMTGWRAMAVGPGDINPDDGSTISLASGEWALIGSDGTTTFILRSGAGLVPSFTPRGAWDAGTSYSQNDVVSNSGNSYISMQDTNLNHDPDDALEPTPDNTWWMTLSIQVEPDVDSVNGQTGVVVLDAGDIAVTPVGSLAATDVQAALAELDSDLSGIVAAQDAMVFKGVIDASSNPNYPAADRGHTYRISVAGKIGGASGPNVEVSDLITCITDGTLTGDHAAVGSAWTISQGNTDGAMIGPASSTSQNLPRFSNTTGKLLEDSGESIASLIARIALDGTETVFTDDADITAAHKADIIVFNKATAVAGTFDAAATLGANWSGIVTNVGAGTLTLTIDGAEAFDDGETSIELDEGQSLFAVSNGTVIRVMLRGGGAGSGIVTPNVDVFTSAGQTTFTATVTPANEDSLLVFEGGIIQSPNTYTLSGNDVIMDHTVTSGEIVVIFVLRGTTGQAGVSRIYQSYAATTGQTVFTLPAEPLNDAALDVIVGGVPQQKGSTAYTWTGTTLTLSAGANADGSGETVEVIITQPLGIGVPAAESVGATELKASDVAAMRTKLAVLALAGGTLTGDLLLDDSTNVTTAPPLAFDGDPNTGIGHPGADRLAFTTGGVQRAEFTSAGVFDLISGQVKFPGTQAASADANTLDDYEEGTWTPVLTFSTPGNVSVTYTRQLGHYTKIGNKVFATVNVVTSAFTHTTASGEARITGLPFTSNATAGVANVSGVRFTGYTSAGNTYVVTNINESTTYISFLAAGSGSAGGALTTGELPTGGTIVIRSSCSYIV